VLARGLRGVVVTAKERREDEGSDAGDRQEGRRLTQRARREDGGTQRRLEGEDFFGEEKRGGDCVN